MSEGSSSRPIGVGIVGAGPHRGWARVAHLPALRAIDRFALRAVSTTRMDSARASADALGIALAFDDHRDLVGRPEVELVVVAVKVPGHHAIVRDALAAGKMVYCEWPLARNLAEAEELAALARAAQRKTVVGLQGRHHPPIRFLRDLVRQGVIGRPLSTSIRAHPTEATWYGHFDPPFEYMADSANGATMLSIAVGHALEPLAQVLGELESLSGVAVNRRGHGVRLRDGSSMQNDTPDEIAAVGLIEGGVVASLHYSAGSAVAKPMSWEIQGSAGSLLIESATAGYLHMGDLGIVLRRGSEPPRRIPVPAAYFADFPGLSGAAAGVARLYARLAVDIEEGTSTVPDIDTALRRHRTLDAITHSFATGDRARL
ncbi:Gfo/Idh/MocA family protein [Massilia sp. 9I]|uniref:Gfo/Idh/MocA family protein n=1 Tax=Massilia sp. 9I TaxID=2653152 RepID=UPI0012F08496|nr:Gfo/Idh/MocA family oxidoreductase [Massilia sp. 9I]VXB15567.1 Oxidoreductase [Massilia sp. 9I]